MNASNIEPPRGIPSGIEAFGKPSPELPQLVGMARGLRDKARSQAASAAQALQDKASKLDALLHEADALAGAIESAELEVRRGEERMSGLRDQLGGAEPNPKATVGRCVRQIVDGAERSFGNFQSHDLLVLAQSEVLIRHREAILAEAASRWLDAPKRRVAELQGRLREVEQALAAEAEGVPSAE